MGRTDRTPPSQGQEEESHLELGRAARLILSDRFTDDREAGTVVGSSSTSGAVRRGIDRDRDLAIDSGALRIQFPLFPGWGRRSLSYGPYPRRVGTALSVLVLNGHNASQTWPESFEFAESRKQRLRRIVKGTIRRFLSRGFIQALLSDTLRKRVRPENPHRYEWPPIKENLSVGWFPRQTTSSPTASGNAFVMQAAGVHNGTLHVRVSGESLPVVRSVQNVPLLLICILRETGAAYYVASLPGVPGVGKHPMLRPVGIDIAQADSRGFLGVNQSILGEVAFRVDSRIYAVNASHLPAYDRWYGTAHLADSLVGSGRIHQAPADAGGHWLCVRGGFAKTNDGALALEPDSLAWMKAEAPVGLVHVLLDGVSSAAPVGVVWRMQDRNNYWAVLVGRGKVRLFCVQDGEWEAVASEPLGRTKRGPVPLQVLDDGATFQISLKGRVTFGHPFDDVRFGRASGIGIYSREAGGKVRIRNLEVHPREVPLPKTLDAAFPWVPPETKRIFSDSFLGQERDLDGQVTAERGGRWERSLGEGIIDALPGGGAKVRASAKRPNPGRTIYTVRWGDPSFADLTVEIMPPGQAQGEGEKGRGGLVFWQDDGNYIIVNTYLDDWKVGRSISSFFRIEGEEDLYRAVWTNVGGRLHWGAPYQLRVCFDGNHYMVYLNGEPVLYRALTDVFPRSRPLAINRVGIVANWEYGDDTGSVFRSFEARTAK
jgi:hypothetical protein